ncbi:MAG: CDGSH iron-sulfur domain-containing protein [Erysipelotrichaceae bacterium]|jgi:CDGSH-type Zn-finger protein|nr:CDGSH iron-sulfur domain-containing protein [Erysipelotrichaceae bacterium]
MKIKILKKGPYEITNDVPLHNDIIVADEAGISTKWQKGKQYDVSGSPTYHVCRCGRSSHKPFCDGTHVHRQFNDEEQPVQDAMRFYRGEKYDLEDHEQYCASLRFCDRAPRAWNAAIFSGRDDNDKIAVQECGDCLSGRLVLKDKNGNAVEPKLPKEIGLVQDIPAGCRGPLAVKGGIELEGATGTKYKVRNRMTLCRCGESSNMPFCDTSHRSCPHMRGSDENEPNE